VTVRKLAIKLVWFALLSSAGLLIIGALAVLLIKAVIL
jgi:hypothetical protein